MPHKVDIFPDAELILVVGLAPLLGDTVRVVTSLPAVISVTTVRVKRVSGAASNVRIDRPIIDIDVFDPDYGKASAVSREIQALLFGLRGQQLMNGVIIGLNVIQGPRWLPEPDPNLFRFGASYQCSVHAP